MNNDYQKDHYQTVPSNLEDVECWEISKEYHYTRTTDDLCLPLPGMFSVRAEIAEGFGYSLPFRSYVLEDIQKHIEQAEDYYKDQQLVIADRQDIRDDLDQHYGVL